MKGQKTTRNSEAEELNQIDHIINSQLTEEAENKMWAVIFTSREDWDSPTVKFIKAKTREGAFLIGLVLIGCTEENANVLLETEENDYIILEVEEDLPETEV